MIKHIYQPIGEEVVIGIQGEPEEITRDYWGFYNWMATNEPEPLRMSNNFIYFWTTPEKLKKCLVNREFCHDENQMLAEQRATSKIENMTKESFVPQNQIHGEFFEISKFLIDKE